MKLALNIYKVKIDGVGFVVLWEPTEDMPIADKVEQVCLSRLKGGNCVFKIDDLAAHNSHTPKFNSVGDMNSYINRVITDVKSICNINGITFETKVHDVEAPAQGGTIKTGSGEIEAHNNNTPNPNPTIDWKVEGGQSVGKKNFGDKELGKGDIKGINLN